MHEMFSGSIEDGDDLKLRTFNIWPEVWESLKTATRKRESSASVVMRRLVLQHLAEVEGTPEVLPAMRGEQPADCPAETAAEP